ncbi:helix-turn-helix domain-containing protein [Kitasatospora purpeofusca]|uniref:helix-turn-helix domain-containing protein n=1 Tax=Kitasatospora purpeofusca TaxID=67352 RepID=UPI00368BAB77
MSSPSLSPSSSPGPFLTYEGLADLLGVTDTWLRRHIKKLPHEKYGREIRFFPEHVAEIRRIFSVTPVSNPTGKTGPVGPVPLAARGRAAA